jgi:hypothetical protein
MIHLSPKLGGGADLVNKRPPQVFTCGRAGDFRLQAITAKDALHRLERAAFGPVDNCP